MDKDRDLLIQLLDGALPEAEAQAVRERLQHEPALRARLDRLRALRQTLEAARPESFAPYFSTRVMRRLAPARTEQKAESLYEALRWVFARAAVASLFAAGALGTYNVLSYQALGVVSSVVEALFGLPSASLADALSYGPQ
jgi:anti-sigma factor RsiW